VTGFYGNVSAKGGANSGNGGFVEISGKENLVFEGKADVSSPFGTNGTILFDPANITIVAGTGFSDEQLNSDVPVGDLAGQILVEDDLRSDFQIGALTLASLTGNILLEATDNITVAPGVSLSFSFASGRSVTFTADADSNGIGSFAMDTSQSITTQGRNLTISGASITTGTIQSGLSVGNGGSVTLTSTVSNGWIRTQDISTGSADGSGGAISITTQGGDIETGNLSSRTFFSGNGGNITLNVQGVNTLNLLGANILTGNIESFANVSSGRAGDIRLLNANTITTGTLIAATGGIQDAPNGGEILLNATRNITTGETIQTRNNNITLNGPVTLTADTSICLFGPDYTCGNSSGNVTLNGTVNGNYNLAIDAGSRGNVFFNNAVGNSTPIKNLTINTADNVSVANNITTDNGNLIFSTPVTLTGNVELRAGTGAIAFDSRLQAGSNNLTLTANEINLNGGANSVTGTGNLTLQPGTATQPIQINGASSVTNNLNLTTDDLLALQKGFNSITIGRTDGSGAINVANNVTFPDPVKIQSPSGSITVNGSITGSGGASVTLEGATTLNNNITTDNQNITLNGNVLLGNDAILSTNTSGAGDITINGAVNGNRALTLTTGTGNITINRAVGDTQAIGNLIANSSGTTHFDSTVNATTLTTDAGGITELKGNVTTSGNQTYNDAVSLANDLTLNSSGNGNITFANTVDGSQLLNLRSGTGTVQFNNAIGKTMPLTGLDVEAGTVNADSTLTVAGGGVRINAVGKVDLADTVTTNRGGSVGVTAGGDITTHKIISEAGITLSSTGGDINTSGGVLDSSSATGSGGNINLRSDRGAITTSNLNSSGAIDGGDIQLNASRQITTGQINASGTSGKGGNVTLDPTGDIQVDWINAQGGTTGGIVDIRTQGFLRATDTFSTANGLTSISTNGGSQGGAIAIRHGGNGVTPFIVGDATINGTAGAIASRNNAIAPEQSFLYTHTQGNIEISSVISVDPPSGDKSRDPDPTSSVNPVDLTISQTQSNSPPLQNNNNNNTSSLDKSVQAIDESAGQEFGQYFGLGSTPGTNLSEARTILRRVENATGIKPAVIYALFVPASITPVPASATGLEGTSAELSLLRSLSPQDSDRLELILIAADGKPIRKSLNTTRAEVLSIARELRLSVTNVRNSTSYLVPAKQMYQLLVAPLEKDLQQLGINNLIYITDTGLRTIPLAALHDDNGFIVERYSVGLMPSLSLTDTEHSDIRNAQVLAMGASEFPDNRPLPAVPLELATITKTWSGRSFLNKDFTLDNLKKQRQQNPYGIVHLATHAEFQPGNPTNSYIQLTESKLAPNQIPSLGWTKPLVDLLVLSACRTAIGDNQVELGFAGLAVQAGVKSALASLWDVNDEGTLGLMSEFYQELKEAPIKAEALRRAQLAMIRDGVRIQGGKLVTTKGEFPLPPALVRLGDKDLSHPYYWSAFTMIGNPW
jgi:CHAT domain-containing protein